MGSDPMPSRNARQPCVLALKKTRVGKAETQRRGGRELGSFWCVFMAFCAHFFDVTSSIGADCDCSFNPEKGRKFQYFPVLSRREGILECPFFSSARPRSGAVSISGGIMPYLLPFVKDKTRRSVIPRLRAADRGTAECAEEPMK